MAKISIIGAGNVGATTASWLLTKNIGDIVLIDIDKDTAYGKALDLQESGPAMDQNFNIIGTDDYRYIENSDIVVITAGLPRKPGMSRDDLLYKNKEIVQSISEQVVKYAPSCILIVVSNPLDAMVHVAHKITKFPKNMILGMAGILDTSRLTTFLIDELNVPVKAISTMVLGGHGDDMVPVISQTKINGQSLRDILSKEKIDKLVQRTRDGGIEIVNYLKSGSAYYAPGASISLMVESILKNTKRILPCSVLLDGEYGVHGYFVGVPVQLGKGGIEKIIELNLNKEEKQMFDKTVAHIKELVDKIQI
jgi:malate dehydrogenase